MGRGCTREIYQPFCSSESDAHCLIQHKKYRTLSEAAGVRLKKQGGGSSYVVNLWMLRPGCCNVRSLFWRRREEFKGIGVNWGFPNTENCIWLMKSPHHKWLGLHFWSPLDNAPHRLLVRLYSWVWSRGIHKTSVSTVKEHFLKHDWPKKLF